MKIFHVNHLLAHDSHAILNLIFNAAKTNKDIKNLSSAVFMFDTLRANKLLLGKFKDIKFLIKLKFASFNFMAFIADISLKVCNIIMLLIM